jgi:hypothetical protein
MLTLPVQVSSGPFVVSFVLKFTVSLLPVFAGTDDSGNNRFWK